VQQTIIFPFLPGMPDPAFYPLETLKSLINDILTCSKGLISATFRQKDMSHCAIPLQRCWRPKTLLPNRKILWFYQAPSRGSI